MFSKLSNLTYIGISSNKLEIMHSEMFQASSKLRSINLSSNQLMFINKNEFSKLNVLYRFDLKSNKLVSLDENLITNCPFLTFLCLTDNLFPKKFSINDSASKNLTQSLIFNRSC